jgi:putative SOS response-associated peptidase YedK
MGIAKKPAFRTAIRSKRCLVIASGFYEGPEKEKLDKPYYISKKNGELFSFAGIWDTWTDPETGEVSNTFGIITVAPNSTSQQIGHHRSPLILSKEDEQKWLDDRLPLEEVLGLLKPYPGEEFKADPISIKVKNPRYKSRDLIVPVGKNRASEPERAEQQSLNLQESEPHQGENEPLPQQGSLL